jgi:hypothetical protein
MHFCLLTCHCSDSKVLHYLDSSDGDSIIQEARTLGVKNIRAEAPDHFILSPDHIFSCIDDDCEDGQQDLWGDEDEPNANAVVTPSNDANANANAVCAHPNGTVPLPTHGDSAALPARSKDSGYQSTGKSCVTGESDSEDVAFSDSDM